MPNNPQDSLNILQRLLTALPQNTEDQEDIVKQLIATENSPSDFAENPAKALGQTGQAALRLLLAGGTAPLKQMAPAANAVGEFGKGLVQSPTIDLNTIRINAAKKAAAKQADLEVQQAIPQVGIEGIVQAANDMAQQQQQPVQQQDISPALAGQPMQDTVKKGLPDNVGNVESFFRMLGIGASPDTELMRAQTEAVKQKIAGQEPLQAGDREKLQLEGLTDFKKIALKSMQSGSPLPGFTQEQTEIIAGVRGLRDMKVTADDLKNILEITDSRSGLSKMLKGQTVKDLPPEIQTKYLEQFGMKLKDKLEKMSTDKQEDEEVVVTNPSGKKVYIPKNQLKDALKKGYKQ